MLKNKKQKTKKQETDITFRMVSCVSAGAITHSVLQNTSTETWKRHISVTFACVSATFNWDKNFSLLWLKHDENMNKKWSGSAVYATTETRVNVKKPPAETQVISLVSRTV